jgi:diguanylate cyclase (GGDEF)-like protein
MVEEQEFELPGTMTALNVVRATGAEDASVANVAAVIEADPGLSLRLLSSAQALGAGGRITSVRQAASRLGLKGLRLLALGLAAADLADMSSDGSALLGLCLRRGLAARAIADETGCTSTDEAYTLGMLLDLPLFASSARLETSTLTSTAALERPVQERALGLPPHPELAASMARGLGLPKEHQDALRQHHATEAPSGVLPSLAWAAERFAAVFEGGAATQLVVEAQHAGRLLGLEDEATQRILDGMPAALQQASADFGRDLGEQGSLENLLLDSNAALLEMNQRYESTLVTMHRLLDDKERLLEELREVNARLDRLATFDELTGLANRRLLMDQLRRELDRARRDGKPMTVILIDLDHFKQVNDTYGHLGGDAVLVKVSATMKEIVRAGDLPARYGGEELCVVLPSTSLARGAVVAERIRRAIEAATIEHEDQRIQVTASFGVATAQGADLGDGPEALLERADAALYRAKGGGRNRVERDAGPDAAPHAVAP